MPDIEFDKNGIYDMSYGLNLHRFKNMGFKRMPSVDGLGILVEQAGCFFQWHGKHPETREVLDTLRL